MIDLLGKNGPFFKANLHSHTTFSDGRMTAAQSKDWYQSHGYSILAFTDHSKYADYPELRTPDFLAVAGFEAAFTCLDLNHKGLKYKLCHINFYAENPETSVFIPEEHTYDVGVINRYIQTMKKNGWLCALNHPGWSLQTAEEVNELRGLDGFEVYNNGAYILHNNGDSQAQYALFLCAGNRAWATATDDNHVGFSEDGTIDRAADDSLGGFTMMSMPSLSYENFVDCFKNGRFYASTGPTIENLYIDEDRDMLVIDCSPVKNILVKGVHTIPAAKANAPDDSLTHAEFPMADIRGKEPHFRVEITTADMHKAYSQPYWFDEV